jgi:hypothetical protein
VLNRTVSCQPFSEQNANMGYVMYRNNMHALCAGMYLVHTSGIDICRVSMGFGGWMVLCAVWRAGPGVLAYFAGARVCSSLAALICAANVGHQRKNLNPSMKK